MMYISPMSVHRQSNWWPQTCDCLCVCRCLMSDKQPHSNQLCLYIQQFEVTLLPHSHPERGKSFHDCKISPVNKHRSHLADADLSRHSFIVCFRCIHAAELCDRISLCLNICFPACLPVCLSDSSFIWSFLTCLWEELVVCCKPGPAPLCVCVCVRMWLGGVQSCAVPNF